MMKVANPVGNLGENIAVDYLKKKGYKIVERNFRKKYEEIDIVAVHDSTIVFIEVKTRKSDSYGTPFEGVSQYKVNHLVALAQFYKQTHKNLPDDMRIDAVGVILGFDNSIEKIEHLENISGF
jgi:putative endonuclease